MSTSLHSFSVVSIVHQFSQKYFHTQKWVLCATSNCKQTQLSLFYFGNGWHTVTFWHNPIQFHTFLPQSQLNLETAPICNVSKSCALKAISHGATVSTQLLSMHKQCCHADEQRIIYILFVFGFINAYLQTVTDCFQKVYIWNPCIHTCTKEILYPAQKNNTNNQLGVHLGHAWMYGFIGLLI